MSAVEKVLVVEDDSDLRRAVCETLNLAGMSCVEAENGVEALALLDKHGISVIVSDINMPKMDGHALLARVRQAHRDVPIIMMTAYGSIDSAVESIREGAIDYIVKPFEPQVLIEKVQRIVSTATASCSDTPIAHDPFSKKLFKMAKRLAEAPSSVLITGESGTGKEVLARYIHNQSPRSDKPFVAINCAAIPESMLEGILFGHEKGAFTGAQQSAPGKFEQANGGTLLLDEIGEMPVGLQAKLLRVLQEREVERIGSKKPIPLDLRIIATTNRDLKTEVAQKKFREDLFYRLNVFPLQWIPLRARPGDIVPLAESLTKKYARSYGVGPLRLDEAAANMLMEYQWPGNVRELDNVIQRAIILQTGGVIRACDILIHYEVTIDDTQDSRYEQIKEDTNTSADRLCNDLRRHEFSVIIETLRAHNGSKKTTAETLGISPRTLRYKLAKMRESGINVEAEMCA